MKTFISHSTKDAILAKKICDSFEKSGISCFIAPRDIRAGHVYSEEIINGIDQSDVMVFIASKNSFESQHVIRELERAVNQKMKIIVYKIDDSEVPKAFEYFIMLNQWIDASATQKIPELVSAMKGEKLEPNNTSDLGRPSETSNTFRIILLGFIAIFVLFVACFLLFILPIYLNKNTNIEVEVSEDEIEPLMLGSKFTMGVYNGEPIQWTVLAVSDNGACYVLADNIITIKPYDVAESGVWNQISETEEYDYELEDTYTDEELITARGSNVWDNSNIRYWLNSADLVVDYYGMKPCPGSSYDERIYYDREPGFLSSFTEEELQRMIETNGDFVFLPSTEEADCYVLNSEYTTVEVKPTDIAYEEEQTGEAKNASISSDGYFPWFTRTADGDYCDKVIIMFGNEFTLSSAYSYEECVGFPRGIRPAMWITAE